MDEQNQPNKINFLNQDGIKSDIQKDFPEIPNKTGLPKWLTILITVLVIAIIGIGGYFVYSYYFNSEEPVACTEEARVCPDGSSVGRIAPNCEFAECSEVVDPTADWQTYRNESAKFEIKYPKDWSHSNEMPVYGIGYEVFVGSFFKNGEKICGLDISSYSTEKFENSLKSWYQEYETLLSQGTKVDINGISAIRVPTRPEYFMYNYWVERKDEKYYSFDIGISVQKVITNEDNVNVVMPGDEFYVECSDTFDQILSTFKFID